MSTDITVWIAAICTLAIFSFLWKENPFYRLFEHIFLGLGVGYTVMTTWTDALKSKWWDQMIMGFQNGTAWSWIGILAFVFGMLWYFQYSKRYHWVSRITIGLTLGAGAGITFKREFASQIPQLIASFKPLDSFSNVFFVITLITVLTYFFFSIGHKSQIIRESARIGRYLLMISLGAFFANTVMTRFAVFLDRIQFLLIEWLKIAK